MGWIESHAPRDAHVVDAGCGIGHLELMLSRAGFSDFVAIDCEPPIVTAARQFLQDFHVAADLRLGDAFAELSKERPDLVVSLAWLQNVRDGLPEFGRVVSTVLRPGGVWIFDALDPPHHDSYGYTREEVHRILDSLGLELVDARDFGQRDVFIARKGPGSSDTPR